VKPVLERLGGLWVFAASSEADRQAAAAWPEGTMHGNVRLRLVDLPPEIQRGHYAVISNALLKPLFHYLLDLAYEPGGEKGIGSTWESYRAVNERFAAVLAAARPRGPLLIQDYHLMLVGAALARLDPEPPWSRHYFHHVPWCEPEYFSVLPARTRTELLAGALSHDTVAFHAARWAGAFGRCCEAFLPGASFDGHAVAWAGRTVPVLVAPGTVDVPGLAKQACSEPVGRLRAELAARAAGRWMLVRVDRIDRWKNQLRGFLAFEELLVRRPELRELAWFLAILTRSRTASSVERDYERACLEVVERVNEGSRAGTGPGAEPITVLVNDDPASDDRPRSLAAMRLADAALVNPLYDGMNLVAKEVAAVSERDAVLILSRNAGAYDELAGAALGINPFDVAETADAIEAAFDASASERAGRAADLLRSVESSRPEDWVRLQIEAATASGGRSHKLA